MNPRHFQWRWQRLTCIFDQFCCCVGPFWVSVENNMISEKVLINAERHSKPHRPFLYIRFDELPLTTLFCTVFFMWRFVFTVWIVFPFLSLLSFCSSTYGCVMPLAEHVHINSSNILNWYICWPNADLIMEIGHQWTSLEGCASSMNYERSYCAISYALCRVTRMLYADSYCKWCSPIAENGEKSVLQMMQSNCRKWWEVCKLLKN
jgi:hypothetical protein